MKIRNIVVAFAMWMMKRNLARHQTRLLKDAPAPMADIFAQMLNAAPDSPEKVGLMMSAQPNQAIMNGQIHSAADLRRQMIEQGYLDESVPEDISMHDLGMLINTRAVAAMEAHYAKDEKPRSSAESQSEAL